MLPTSWGRSTSSSLPARVAHASPLQARIHTIGFYPRSRTLTVADPYRPDGYYGLSKAYAELLGRLFYDKHGVESIHLRIASCVPEPTDLRHLSTWLSYPDFVRLVTAALTAEAPGYAIVWGVSRNTRGWWSNDDAERIGYRPQDDAENFASANPFGERRRRGAGISGRFTLRDGLQSHRFPTRMNSGAPLVTLAAHGYRLSVSPLHGASLTELTWQAKSGEVSILRPCDASTLSIGEPSPVGCFVMAPFANRIDGGVFTYDGRRHTLAINRPEEDVAIHGLSRLAPFEIVDHTGDKAQLLHRHRGDVFAYDLLQTIRIGQRGVRIDLRVTNRDAERMPFGIGLHPYFVRDEGARLKFRARVRFVSDSRNFQCAQSPRLTGRIFGKAFSCKTSPGSIPTTRNGSRAPLSLSGPTLVCR